MLGCLPAHVQERLENEYNVPASWMSLASALPLFMFGAFCVIAARAAALGGPLLLPPGVLLLGQYLFGESAVRMGIAFLQGRGIGTVAGTVLYEVLRLAWRGFDRVRGRDVPHQKSFFEVEAARIPCRRTSTAFTCSSPLSRFWMRDEQAALTDKFGFDGLRWGRISAFFILVAVGPFAVSALLGFLLVPQTSDLFFLAFAAGLSVEQVFDFSRWPAKRPAPSILRVLVRPAARRLLERTPPE